MSNHIFQKIKYMPLVTCVILLGCISLNSGKGQDASATLVKNAWKANKIPKKTNQTVATFH